MAALNQSTKISSLYHYNVYEAPIEIIQQKLSQKYAKINVALEKLNIVEYDSSDWQKTQDLVDVFNEIALTSVDPYEQINAEMVKENFGYGSFIAYRFGRVVGYVILSFNEEGNVAAIAGIGIHHKARRKGLSIAFLHHIVDWIAAKNTYTAIQADILTSNEASIGLFMSLGFKKVDEFFLC